MSEWLISVFSFVCGRYAPHTWILGGLELPCCQRCTGLYAGAALAMMLHLLFRPSPGWCYRLFHGMCLLQMGPMGLHLVPQDAFLRCLSGQLFAFGLIAFLWRLPSCWSTSVQPARAFETKYYWSSSLLSLAVIPLLVLGDSTWAAMALSAMVLVGGCVLAVLVILHLGHGCLSLTCQIHRAMAKLVTR